MIAVTTRGARELEARYRAAPARVREQLTASMGQAVKLAHHDLVEVGMTGKKGTHPLFGMTGAPAPTIGHRSGKTSQSVNSEVVRSGDLLVGVVGSPAKHLRILERGGDVYGHPWLSIPLARSLTPGGRDRKLRGTFVWPTARQRAGALGRIKGRYVARTGPGGLELLRLLVHKVHLPARHVFASSLERVRPRVEAIFAGAVQLALRGLGP